jgi:multicomponent Na+:H+ antiporter subunit E
LVDDEIIVHALLLKDVESLETGEMDRRVTMLER